MKIITEIDQKAVMRDGTQLYTDLYYPETDNPLPAILMRLPYDKTHGQDYIYPHPKRFAMNGYLVVVQDTRGRWKSGGEFYPFRNEMEDGYDTVEWVASLPQCDGNVGMYGFSYVGVIQLLAAAANPPHLRCICPAMTGSSLFEGWTYNHGAFSLAFNLSWSIELAISDAHRRGSAELEQELWKASANIKCLFPHLPLSDASILKKNNLAAYYFEWMEKIFDQDYWKEFNFNSICEKIIVPSMFIAGWYDVFRDGTIANYLSASNSTDKKLIIGPWYHVPWVQQMGDIDFGENAKNQMGSIHLNWFDRWLKGQNQTDETPIVKFFVLGSNKWREDHQWPPKSDLQWKLFLHSETGANSRFGDGLLNPTPPKEEPPDVYVYDPRSPNQSMGGHSCCFPAISPMGPVDQRSNEIQNQILVYTTEKLPQDIGIAGLVEAELYVSSTAIDTDFVIKLIDVHEDGTALNILEGIQRMRNWLSEDGSEKMHPDEIYQVRIGLGNTCYVFKKAHQIRVEITSSDFPQWDRNTNSGKNHATDTFLDLVVALQTIHHDRSAPSHIVLPCCKEII